ncbi:uncharacterized protein N7498_003047 [Penicillium cinerascens]|uniref:Rhodopsin domain-containing protein n=1 Tax=Penicillium cinerascens TaxID=70096 RepID=A0A9W9NB72_9EURO|nr:uncharacterized protein N7498_003047 [Penicillium cinerascens]KAJ5216640.1 hypothetical protein N7498_003047 [Penicillium cinerascens]
MSVTIYDGNFLFLINYATQILCFIVTTPFVLLRVFVRWKVNHALGIDDALCFIGWVLFMGYCANALIYGFSGCTKVRDGLNQDQYESCIKARATTLRTQFLLLLTRSQISYVATAIYAPTALFVKSSLVYVLIRVFQPWSRRVLSLYCLLGVVVGYYFIITFIKIFICNPVSAYWIFSERGNATCLSQAGVIIADSVISFLTDIAIFAFPVALTWSLQMPFWKKVKVVFLLGLGGIAVAFSLFRLVIGIHERDFPHDTRMFMKSILTANAEVGLGIICSCLPALNVLTTYTKQQSPSSSRAFRRPKQQPQSSGQIFDGSRPGDPQYHLSRSELSTSARRGSTDSARLIASHEQSGLPVGENSDTIIKMVSLNQHWENASQSNETTDRSGIL